MGARRRPILFIVIALVVAGLAVSAGVAGVGMWLTAGALFPDPATLDARETAARQTDIAAVRTKLGMIDGWRVVATRAEASYYTQGKTPVDQRWGLASGPDTVGPDAASVIAGLGTRTVRFLMVGQCAGVDRYTTALALGPAPDAAGSPPPDISYATFSADGIPCDGHAHAVVSQPVTLATSTPLARLWVHVFFWDGGDDSSTGDRLAILVAPGDAPTENLASVEAQAEAAFGGPMP